MARIVTVDGQKYQIGTLGGIRKVDANGNPTGGAVSGTLRKKIREKYMMSGSDKKPMGFMTDPPSTTVKKPNPQTIPKTKSAILDNLQKAFSLDNDILQYMMKNTPGDALKQVITSNRADQKSLVTKAKQEMKVNQKGPTPKPPVPKAKAKPKGMADRKVPKPKTDGNRQAYRPGRGDSEVPKKDAKNPNAAFNTARNKQRRAGKKIEALSNKTVRDTSIKDARPARGPAYDTKAPAKQKPNARALKQIQDRKDKSKNPLSKVMLNKITKELKEGGKPVYNDGMVVGVTHKGLIGTVYTGRPQFNPIKKKKK